MPNSVKPEMLTWARERAGIRPEALAHKFARLGSWEEGSAYPTSEQLSAFARAVYVPLGYLLREKPPVEMLPISDFRSFSNGESASLALRDAVTACVLQQNLYRYHLTEAGQSKLDFVGSAKLRNDAEDIARKFASKLDFSLRSDRRRKGNAGAAFRLLREKADQIGVVVNVNKYVHNSSRKLDADEFRGFALADEYAPLVFVNSADSKSGQIFTLAHDLGHLLLGKSALGDGSNRSGNKGKVEAWCNKFAAELLVPEAELRSKKKKSGLDLKELEALAIYFNVSRQVILLRLLSIKKITKKEFKRFWSKDREKGKSIEEQAATAVAHKNSRGPGYYSAVRARVGSTFAKALCQSVADGHTLTRDAISLLGVKKLATYMELERRILRKL